MHESLIINDFIQYSAVKNFFASLINITVSNTKSKSEELRNWLGVMFGTLFYMAQRTGH
jgi:hypothetical protein